MSTTKQSPGSAPSTAIGPEIGWTTLVSEFFISSLSKWATISCIFETQIWSIWRPTVVIPDLSSCAVDAFYFKHLHGGQQYVLEDIAKSVFTSPGFTDTNGGISGLQQGMCGCSNVVADSLTAICCVGPCRWQVINADAFTPCKTHFLLISRTLGNVRQLVDATIDDCSHERIDLTNRLTPSQRSTIIILPESTWDVQHCLLEWPCCGWGWAEEEEAHFGMTYLYITVGASRSMLQKKWSTPASNTSVETEESMPA